MDERREKRFRSGLAREVAWSRVGEDKHEEVGGLRSLILWAQGIDGLLALMNGRACF